MLVDATHCYDGLLDMFLYQVNKILGEGFVVCSVGKNVQAISGVVSEKNTSAFQATFIVVE